MSEIEWANAPAQGAEEEMAEVEEGDNEVAKIEGAEEQDEGRVNEQGMPSHDSDYSDKVYEELEENAGTVGFYDICTRLEVCRTQKRGDRIKTLFDQEIVNKVKGKGDGKVSLFPIVRLLCSEQDHRSGKLKVKGAKLCEIYIKVLQLSKQDADRLREYRDPKKNDTGGGSVDIGETLKETLKNRVSNKPSGMSVRDVNNLLDKLLEPGEGRRHKPTDELAEFFRANIIERMSYLEQVWLARVIITGETKRCGITGEALIKFLGRNAHKSFAMIKYLRRICADQALGMTSTNGGFRLGYPPKPMLANKGSSITGVELAMHHKPFVMDRKLDGHRLQIHRLGTFEGRGQYYYSTRGTKQGGEKAAALDQHKQDKYESLEPYLDKCITVEKCILDGELMGWDPSTESFVRFEDVCGVHLRPEDRHFQYIAFDIIYIDGKGTEEAFKEAGMEPCKPSELKDRPLDERRRLMRAALKVEEKWVEYVENEEVHSQETTTRIEQLKRFWDRAVEDGWEGLVVKGLHTPYVSASREHWYKLKPDYVNEVEPMDVVILGGYFRQGERWVGKVSRFLVGIAIDDPTCLDNQDGQRPARRYYAFAKVASGLDTEKRERLNEKLEKHWIDPPADGAMPPWLSGWYPTKEDRPARFIDPKNSVILECVASELVTSSSFNVGYTMRGPRIKSVRYDKPIRDALDYSGFLSVRENFRRSSESAAQPSGKRKGGDKVPRRKGPALAAGFETRLPVEGEDGAFRMESSALEGLRLHVVPFDKYRTSMVGAAELLMPEVQQSKDGTSPSGRGSKSQDRNGRGEDDKRGGATQPATQGGRVKAGPDGGKEVHVDHNSIISLTARHGAEYISQLPKDTLAQDDDDDDSDQQEGARRRKRKRGGHSRANILIVAPAPRCPRVVNIKKYDKEKYGGLRWDVVSLDWLLDSVKAGRRLLPRPHHLYAKTEATEKRLCRTYDDHQDSWIRPVTAEGLAELMRDMEAGQGTREQWRDLADKHLVDDEECAAMDTQATLFYRREHVFYVDCFETLGPTSGNRRPLLTSMLRAVRSRLRLQGARISDVLDKTVTMVVVDAEDATRFGAIVDKEKQVAAQRKGGDTVRAWKVVDRRWVDRCLAEGEMTPPDDDEMLHLPSLVRAAEQQSTPNMAFDE